MHAIKYRGPVHVCLCICEEQRACGVQRSSCAAAHRLGSELQDLISYMLTCAGVAVLARWRGALPRLHALRLAIEDPLTN